jgi:hypothetical protein
VTRHRQIPAISSLQPRQPRTTRARVEEVIGFATVVGECSTHQIHAMTDHRALAEHEVTESTQREEFPCPSAWATDSRTGMPEPRKTHGGAAIFERTMRRLAVTIKVLVVTLVALIARAVTDGPGLAIDLSMGLIALILVGALYLWRQGHGLRAARRGERQRK